jgi:Tol biopolymer transport system component
MAYRTDLSSFITLTQEDTINRGLVTGYPGSFEWSPDGYRIAYLAQGRQQMHLKITHELNPYSAPPYDSITNLLLSTQEGEGALRDVSWVPGEDGRVLVFLQDEAGTGCWTVHIRSAHDPNLEPIDMPGLCVEGGLSRASWNPDSQWLVVLARQPQEETPALYALRIPRSQSARTAPIFERLVDMPFESGSNPAALPKPQVRPAGNGLSINPQSVKAFEPILPPSMPTRDIPGQILYHVYDTPVRGFYFIHPGEDAGKILRDRGENRTCPEISPSGEQVAFLSEANSAHRGTNEVYRMDIDGSNTVQLTTPVFPYEGGEPGTNAQPLPRYSCPVWSPDGSWLAAMLNTSRGSYLMLIDPAVGPMHYVLVPRSSMISRPVWSPDGRHILIAGFDSNQTGQILRLDVRQLLADRLQADVLVEGGDWHDVYGIAYSPDSQWIAYLTAQYRRNANQTTLFDLHIITTEGDGALVQTMAGFYESDARMYYGSNQLFWLPDGRIGMVAAYSIEAQVKSEILLYDPIDSNRISLARLGDVVFDSAWSPDGSWLVYAAETGLWALDISGALEGGVSPVLLNPMRAYEVDWR